MPKHKTHKGLQKRVKVTARGRVKFKHTRSGHLKSKKSGKQSMHIRQKGVAKSGDVRRLEKILNRHLLRHPETDTGPKSAKTTETAAVPAAKTAKVK